MFNWGVTLSCALSPHGVLMHKKEDKQACCLHFCMCKADAKKLRLLLTSTTNCAFGATGLLLALWIPKVTLYQNPIWFLI